MKIFVVARWIIALFNVALVFPHCQRQMNFNGSRGKIWNIPIRVICAARIIHLAEKNSRAREKIIIIIFFFITRNYLRKKYCNKTDSQELWNIYGFLNFTLGQNWMNQFIILVEFWRKNSCLCFSHIYLKKKYIFHIKGSLKNPLSWISKNFSKTFL